MQSMSLTEKSLQEVIARIVRTAQPRRIVLFGSAARAQLGPDSDLDLLVVVADGSHRRQTAAELYRVLWDVGFPKDIVVVTESDMAEFAEDPSLVIRPALREGKELYRAA